jgi:ABC-type transport system involved in cytochrome bd biosynthesis fused ATPase/permease subunit
VQKLAVSLQAVRLRQLGPIDLNVRQGERVALIGSSGAGKTSLLHLMAGELQPDEGVVQARGCSWMTQRTELFQDSLRNNLRLADAKADDEQLWASCRLQVSEATSWPCHRGWTPCWVKAAWVCPEASRAGWHWPDCC